MKELLDASFSTVNLLPTVFLLLCFLFWITVVIGVFDLDSFDLDVEADVDMDVDLDVEVDADVAVDADADVDTEVEADSGLSFLWLNSVLSFFNMGKVPFMILFSFFSLSFWAISIMINHYTGNTIAILGLAFLIPNFVVSLFVAKIFTTPFVKIFGKLNESNAKEKWVIGKECKVLLPATQEQMGQAEISVDGNTLRINIKAFNEAELQVGESALAIEYIEKDNLYLVEPYKN